MGRRGDEMQAEVLAVLRACGQPASAYAVLDALRADRPKLAPPTIYRALAALTARGQVHRVESLNAYIACRSTCDEHASVLSICDDCGAVEESDAPEVVATLADITGKTGFAPQRHVIEVHGRCSACAPGQGAA